MQVNVVNGGPEAFSALLYEAPNENMLNYLNTQMANAAEALAGTYNSFLDNARSIYNKFNSTEAINAAKAVIMSNSVHLSDTQVLSLTAETLKNANYVMQQYIMANPEVNKLHNDNMCYGFAETYYDEEPEVTGTDRNDYRRVMDGVLDITEEEPVVVYYTCGDDHDDLVAMDTFSILDTWEAIEQALADDIDPTSPDGDEL